MQADALIAEQENAPLVLVCEDMAAERAAVAQFLRGHGYRVDEAADGRAALLRLKQQNVDVLILDLQMPDVDGFDVLRHVQKNLPELAVVLLSGMPLEKIQRQIAGLPQRELPPLLIKPYAPQQLLQVMEMQLQSRLGEQS